MGYFGEDTFAFLRELKRNNDRDWFNANKDRYEGSVKEPFLQFINDVGPALRKVSRNLVADPRPVGGSMFRIYRDVRFSKDKSPYKTHAGIHFRHAFGKDAHAPGFYLHLEPGGSFAGVGIWRGGPATLGKIRDAIVDDPDAWISATREPPFADAYTLGGD